MQGLMMDYPLTLDRILEHANRQYTHKGITTKLPNGSFHRYTYADYVGIETYSETKHEFLDGEIYAMLGGTRDHSALAGSMIRLLGNAVGDRPCAVHTSDLRIYVEAVGLATYPDASVVCEPFQEFAAGPKSTAPPAAGSKVE